MRVGQRGMVLVAVALLRQTFGNSFNRIFAAAVAGGLRPIEHGADALTDTSSRLGLGQPNRREHAQHGGGVDLIDAMGAELRAGILLKGVAPLLSVLCVRPRSFVLAVDALDGLGEGRHNVLGFAALGQRVAALSCGLAIGQCPFACFGQRHEGSPTQADIAAATLHNEAQEPSFRTGRVDDEVETVPIGIAAGLFELAHLHCGEHLFRMLALTLHKSSAGTRLPHIPYRI
ncbi:thymidine phosphorylase [Methylorubrum populi]|uniref:Thymidine phosphorylase n=1 Tax=Methylorubrum populi TaxID=223967 RepID=A0A160PL44_9HYPH|nr:thymidine phosphorylase [Methylorubrum populi]